MKVYWTLSCDFGHTWSGYCADEAELPAHCPKGHEAVQVSRHEPIDQVQVSIRPAGRIVDPVTMQTAHERKVTIVVSNLQETWAHMIQGLYSWREAENILRKFEGVTEARAKDIITAHET